MYLCNHCILSDTSLLTDLAIQFSTNESVYVLPNINGYASYKSKGMEYGRDSGWDSFRDPGT